MEEVINTSETSYAEYLWSSAYFEEHLLMFTTAILAIYLLAVGIGMLNGSLNTKKLLSSIEKSQGLLLTAGLICIAMGLILIKYHNYWYFDLDLIITLTGWGSLIKGILLIASPETIFSAGKMASKQNSNLISFIALFLGASLHT